MMFDGCGSTSISRDCHFINGDHNCVAHESAIERLTLSEDEAYFSCYAGFSIHSEMLKVFDARFPQLYLVLNV